MKCTLPALIAHFALPSPSIGHHDPKIASPHYGSRDYGYGICTKNGWQGISIDDL